MGPWPHLPRSKYGNVKTTIGGETFASKREALRHLVLKDMQKHGEIRGLKRQPVFELVVNGVLICKYIGDWEYFQKAKPDYPTTHIVEDAKGFQTKEFIIKWKLCQALYPGVDWRIV